MSQRKASGKLSSSRNVTPQNQAARRLLILLHSIIACPLTYGSLEVTYYL